MLIFIDAAYHEGMRVTFIYKGHQVKVKVTGATKIERFLLLQYKTLIGNNSSTIKHRAMNFACSMVFSDMVD